MDSIASQVPLSGSPLLKTLGGVTGKTSKLRALSVTIVAADEETRMGPSMAAVLSELFTFRED